MDSPKIAQRSPYVMQLEPGRYAWCACGKSASQPYCDGSHRGSSFAPRIEQIDAPRKVAWCGCKHSANAPFCDGAHARLPE